MLHTVSADAINNARNNMIAGLIARRDIEVSNNAADPVIAKIEGKYIPAATKLDAFTCAYAASIDFDFIPHLCSVKNTGAMFNVYALEKLWGTMRVLNGGTYDRSFAQELTVVGILEALARGITMQSQLAYALDDFMTAIRGKTYTSGNAQGTSALRALEVFGIVKEAGRYGNVKLWNVADAALFQRCLDGARGVTATAPLMLTHDVCDAASVPSVDVTTAVPFDLFSDDAAELSAMLDAMTNEGGSVACNDDDAECSALVIASDRVSHDDDKATKIKRVRSANASTAKRVRKSRAKVAA